MLTRLQIQVNQKSKQVATLQKNLESTQNELVKVKKILQEQQAKKSRIKNISMENPNIQNHYKKKMRKLQQANTNLKERLRTYTLQEKRILIKEKAFELERADTSKKVINLNDNITRLKIENSKLKIRKTMI